MKSLLHKARLLTQATVLARRSEDERQVLCERRFIVPPQ